MEEGWGRQVRLVLTMPEAAPVAPGPDSEECVGRKRAARYGLLRSALSASVHLCNLCALLPD